MNRLSPIVIVYVLISDAASAVTPSPVQSFQLPSGLRVRLSEDHGSPLVRLEFRVTWDKAEIPPGREALVGFLGRMLNASGANGLDRDAFLRTLEEKALRSSFHWSPDACTWSMLATSQNIDPAFQNLASALARPTLSEAALEAQRQILSQEIGARTPGERAKLTFLRSLGDPLSLASPDGAFLSSIQFKELDQLRRRILRPAGSVLAIRGDVNLDQARQLAALHFGAWGPGVEPPLALAPAATGKGEARIWMLGDPTGPLEFWVGSPLQEGETRRGAARQLATRLLRRELAQVAIPGVATLDLKETPWVLQVIPMPGTSKEDAMKGLQALLIHLRQRIWKDTDLAWAEGTWKAENRVRSLHPAQIAEALSIGEMDAPGPTPALGEIEKLVHGWLDPSTLRGLILGAKAEDQALLEKMGIVPRQAEK